MIDDAPPLWPGMNPNVDTRVATAWRSMWAATSSTEWTPLGTMIATGGRASGLAHHTMKSLGKTALDHLEVRTIKGTNRREVRRR